MKKLFIVALWTIIFNSLALEAKAQDASTCFMLDSNGNSMNLGNLCQNKNKPRSNPVGTLIPPKPKTPGIYSIPIKRKRSGIPVIDVTFNGKYTFEMMLDTGASSIVITPQMAKKLRVNHHETIRVSTPSDNNVKLSSGYVYTVQVAGLKQKNARVITAPKMDMGLLGQSFFSQYDLTIKNNVVEFRER